MGSTDQPPAYDDNLQRIYYQPAPPPIGFNIAVPVQSPTNINYGPTSQQVICPSCHAQIISSLKTEATTKTHLSALLLFCFLCWPCACCPYCMDSCQNINHYCPNCMAYLGTYHN